MNIHLMIGFTVQLPGFCVSLSIFKLTSTLPIKQRGDTLVFLISHTLAPIMCMNVVTLAVTVHIVTLKEK